MSASAAAAITREMMHFRKFLLMSDDLIFDFCNEKLAHRLLLPMLNVCANFDCSILCFFRLRHPHVL